ncbi:Cathepsin F [Strongyloides ratti]|uniref:Cathepsin F n=1 Tax=Strongyloides ratti TaxID=34506 RepID=A0A090LGI5_STRRB|nr:Cathepsin F [Strongyloides ratti]CEF68916.1 Cathepsin F [Strongyloides ratti]
MENTPSRTPYTVQYQKLYDDTVYPGRVPSSKYKESNDEKLARFAAYILTFFVVLAVIVCIPLLISIIGTALENYRETSSMPLNESLIQMDENCNMSKEFYDYMNRNMDKQFINFVLQFNKCYKNIEEMNERQKIFFKNVKRDNKMVEKANVKMGVENFEVNYYADWSDDEFKDTMLMKKPNNKMSPKRPENSFVKDLPSNWREEKVEKTEGPLPEYFDWRKKGVITPVRCQKRCGLCYGFASVATMEANYAIVSGNLRNFSEQEILDCNLENNGCNGGEPYLVYKYAHDNGMVTAEDYPYVAHRQNVCALNPESKRAYVKTAFYLHPDEDSMLDWLYHYGPITVNIAVPKSMKQYTSGIYSPNDYECEYEVLGLHSLTVVGYGTEVDGEKYWIVKNSWNGRWGESGYVRFARGRNACGIEHEPIGIIMEDGMRAQ